MTLRNCLAATLSRFTSWLHREAFSGFAVNRIRLQTARRTKAKLASSILATERRSH